MHVGERLATAGRQWRCKTARLVDVLTRLVQLGSVLSLDQRKQFASYYGARDRAHRLLVHFGQGNDRFRGGARFGSSL